MEAPVGMPLDGSWIQHNGQSMNYFKNTLTAYFGNKKKKLIETLGKVNKKVNT